MTPSDRRSEADIRERRFAAIRPVQPIAIFFDRKPERQLGFRGSRKQVQWSVVGRAWARSRRFLQNDEGIGPPQAKRIDSREARLTSRWPRSTLGVYEKR